MGGGGREGEGEGDSGNTGTVACVVNDGQGKVKGYVDITSTVASVGDERVRVRDRRETINNHIWRPLA